MILARPFTEADDVAGFHAARGILTSEGGKASHAALVARGMGRPAVVGAGELDIDLRARVIRVGDAGDRRGRADRDRRRHGHGHPRRRAAGRAAAATSASSASSAGRTRSAGWACAPTPTRRPTRAKAIEHGAEGIGLCRTEHMFMAADRQPKMRAMIMARTETERRAALAELLPLQQADFEGLFAAMPGRPITIRLLDPPLHEFLPDRVAARPARAEGARRGRRRAGRARAGARAGAAPRRGQPDARHARLPAGHRAPGDLRDAGRGDHARRPCGGRAAEARDHDPARRLRGRAGTSCARWSCGSASATGCARARTTSSAR